MACERCRYLARSLVGFTRRTGASSTETTTARTVTTLARSHTITSSHSRPSDQQSGSEARPRWHFVSVRRFGSTAERRILGFGSSLTDSYRVLGESQQLFKACSRPADYHISEETRKRDEVERREDGEELGTPVNPNNVWHKTFQLRPSFNTWSHVTMLHLYLLNARVRCLERDAYRSWQQQLVDHFFFECEKKMHLDHNITSSALRQRYLKDIFVQWRGLLLAYDEGLIKGDAILASAVWRNLFKGDAEVDPRHLLAVVGWMRASLAGLEGASDLIFAERAISVLSKPVNVFWTRLEEPFKRGGAADVDASALDSESLTADAEVSDVAMEDGSAPAPSSSKPAATA